MYNFKYLLGSILFLFFLISIETNYHSLCLLNINRRIFGNSATAKANNTELINTNENSITYNSKGFIFMKKIFSLIAIFIALNSAGLANNLSISTASVVEKNPTSQTIKIKFNVSWDNSWRTNAEPNNWDAVWLFVKYKKTSDGKWYHATLSINDANHSTGSMGTEAIIDARGDGKGAFIYRNTNSSGTFASNEVKLCWNYGSDGISNNLITELTELQVFGIEMVYIPQGAFYVGSGGSEYYHFYTNGNSPYQIGSEGVITANQSIGNLWATEGVMIENSTIPASFPKGYNGFYCMKYEITQEQYCDFLNILTRSQQNTRTAINLSSGVWSTPNRYVMSNSNTMNYRNGIRCNANFSATNPITFYCDLNGNNIINQASDGQNIACNYLSWADGIAYSDWSGLRPMTELEYEKICRGSAYPVPNECAWGDTIKVSASIANGTIINSGQADEGSNISGANCNSWVTNSVGGPLRVGCFGGDSRQASGASYYGVMEMSGNLWERCVTVAAAEGRAFTGSLGDGTLDEIGNANIENCPGINAIGSCVRGGSWFFFSSCNTSDRMYQTGANPIDSRSGIFGFRCISGAN